MFHWICPECGSEIPPAVKECPRCEPGSAAASTPAAAPAETPAVVQQAAPAPAEIPPAPPKLPSVPEPVRQLLAAIPAAETAPSPMPAQALEVPETKALEPVPEPAPQLASAAEPAPQLASAAEPVPQLAIAAEPSPQVHEPPRPAPTPEPAVARMVEMARPVIEAPAAPPAPTLPPALPQTAVTQEPELVAEASPVRPVVSAASPQGTGTAVEMAPVPEPESPVPAPASTVPPPPLNPPALETLPSAPVAEEIKAGEAEAVSLAKREPAPVNGIPLPDLVPAPEPVHAAPPVIEPPKPTSAALIETKTVELPVMPAPAPESVSQPLAQENPAVDARAPEAPIQEAAAPLIETPPTALLERVVEQSLILQGTIKQSVVEQSDAEQSIVEQPRVEQIAPPQLAAKEVVPEVPMEPSLAGLSAHPHIEPVQSKPTLTTELTALAVSLSPVAQLPSPSAAGLLPEPAPPRAAERVPHGATLTPRAKAPRWTPPAVAPEAPAERGAIRPEQTAIGPRFASGGLQKTASTVVGTLKPAKVAGRIVKAETHPKVTLPGPSLPPQLTSFAHAGLSVVPGYQPSHRKTGAGDWLLSLALTGFLLAVGVGALTYLSSNSTASAEPAPATVQSAVAQTPTSPLSRLVEVTGFRMVVDLNKKSEIRYLVVNHSGADLGGITIYVTLHASGAKAGQPPLSRFSFRAPDLGPYESKEMASPIEKLPKTVALPEWNDLRADIEIAQ